MKKNENNGQNLSNVFSEIEKVDLTGKELDEQLIEYGFNPRELVRKVRETVDKVKSSNQNDSQPAIEEFDPFLLAAGKNKQKKGPRRPRKND